MNKKNLLKWCSIACGVLMVLTIIGSIINDTVATVFATLFALVFIPEIVLLIMYFVKKKKESPKTQPEKKSKKVKRQAGIKKVKVLGIRTAEETGVFATWNFTMYSVLIIYDNGKREVVECKSDSKLFKDLLPYMDAEKDVKNINKDSSFTDEELDNYDIIDED